MILAICTISVWRDDRKFWENHLPATEKNIWLTGACNRWNQNWTPACVTAWLLINLSTILATCHITGPLWGESTGDHKEPVMSNLSNHDGNTTNRSIINSCYPLRYVHRGLACLILVPVCTPVFYQIIDNAALWIKATVYLQNKFCLFSCGLCYQLLICFLEIPISSMGVIWIEYCNIPHPQTHKKQTK